MDKFKYWWRSFVYGFWYTLSVILYGKEDTEVVVRSRVQKQAARKKVVEHELARRKAELCTDDDPNVVSLEQARDSIQKELKIVRDTGGFHAVRRSDRHG